MNETSPKIVFFGTDAPPVKTFALEHDIPVWQPEKLKDVAEKIVALQPVVGVLVAYGKIIPQSIIDLFDPGIINLHPSLLPRWRGPSPIETAIAQMDQETGVSIMQLTAAMDAGPVYQQTHLPLSGRETKFELYEKLFNSGSELLCQLLPQIVSGQLQPQPQDDSQATYCQLLSKDDSLINPDELTAEQADARVRAYLGFPRSRVQVGADQLIITETHVADQPSSKLDIKCQDGRWLIIDRLVAPSGKNMPVDAYLRGLKT
ncbi:methionyl-tRNA formyltransferase [Candidatus Saccharibacteria bacterium]|nr:MAG: methionyl-tRNA formyltransferase [Candidatus Saccharibacteria bacterium]